MKNEEGKRKRKVSEEESVEFVKGGQSKRGKFENVRMCKPAQQQDCDQLNLRPVEPSSKELNSKGLDQKHTRSGSDKLFGPGKKISRKF